MFQEKWLSADGKITVLAIIMILLQDLQSLGRFINDSEVRYIVISKIPTTYYCHWDLIFSHGVQGFQKTLVKSWEHEILCNNNKLCDKWVRVYVPRQQRGTGLLFSRQVKEDTDKNKAILINDCAVFCFSPQWGWG